ncbi:hypothetical protein K474DRAFT_1643204 [Panus rudis PR-1116 ss-1]|nr:hypothetical protein K474DRAFT_1643204 [Panus rudis PR-1116 ss-1]
MTATFSSEGTPSSLRGHSESQRTSAQSDICGRVVGPLATSFFFDSFMEPSNGLPKLRRVSKKIFEDIAGVSINCDRMTTRLAHAVNNSGLCPNFVLSNRKEEWDTDSHSKIRPRLCLFPENPSNDHASGWPSLELFVDVHPIDCMDPFRLMFKTSRYSLRGDDQDMSNNLLDQLSGFLNAQFSRQHRRFTFALCIFGRYVRFLRVDRSGVVVSEAMNYITNPRILAEFFWRYSHLSYSKRGFDPYAEPATSSERRLLRRAILEYIDLAKAEEARRFPKMRMSLARDYPAYKICVADELSGEVQRFVIRRPFAGGRSLFGRSTRGYVAFRLGDGDHWERQPLSGGLAFLKDTWRISSDELEREADIYEDLKEHGVQFIPTVICAGDVFCNGRPQQTITEALAESIPPQWVRLSRKCRRTYIHHRVAQELAFPLSAVTNAKELVQVIRDALQGLIEAYVKAGRLHRDVSDRNVMISESHQGDSITHGLLNDWDVSRKLHENEPAGSGRVGTWYFMSSQLLLHLQKSNDIYDDLESILWVLVYVAAQHFKHSGRFFMPMFSERREIYPRHASPGIAGGAEKNSFIAGASTVVFLCPALNDLITSLRRFWHEYHYKLEAYTQLHEDPRVLLGFFDEAINRGPEAWVHGEWVEKQYPEFTRGSSERPTSDVSISVGSLDSPAHNPGQSAWERAIRRNGRPEVVIRVPRSTLKRPAPQGGNRLVDGAGELAAEARPRKRTKHLGGDVNDSNSPAPRKRRQR